MKDENYVLAYAIVSMVAASFGCWQIVIGFGFCMVGLLLVDIKNVLNK